MRRYFVHVNTIAHFLIPSFHRQSAVFEAMIALMTPRGFADLMASMWPELIGAIPKGMGPVMRAMGKIPGFLGAMKPMFPVLLPILLPTMMPRVMPTMLSRVADRIQKPGTSSSAVW